ncbi:hypothetical protein ACIF8W_32760 [Streptomyces sp. NPDC085639]|uniref:hypothetical protein n=1 Tax=Streptomyces sp. NPDC085639 TaxID=3365734 RepID=UPI0037D98B9D
MSTYRSTLTRAAKGAPTGLLAAFTALAAAEPVAALVRPAAGPVTVVGGSVIDRTPAPVKDFALRTFGENDKLVLQLGILVLLTLFAVGLGVLALRHRRAGSAGVLLFGVGGAASALSRPDSAGAGDALPSPTGAVAGPAVLGFLAGKAARADSPSGVGGSGGGWSGRGFLTAAAATGAGALGRSLSGQRGREPSRGRHSAFVTVA